MSKEIQTGMTCPLCGSESVILVDPLEALYKCTECGEYDDQGAKVNNQFQVMIETPNIPARVL